MPSLTKKENEILEILRTIRTGFELGILTMEELNNLTAQTHWATGNPIEWTALKAFHNSGGGPSGWFRSSEMTARLPYLCSSYLKMLADTNPDPRINWTYGPAIAWKEALLGDFGGFVSRKPLMILREILSRNTIYIPKAGCSHVKEMHGDVGTVWTFEWQGLGWVFKPEEDSCDVPKANESGIPHENAHMNNRSVASYLLAKALGLEKIMVSTVFAYWQGNQQLVPGIVMEKAGGDKPLVMQPDLAAARMQWEVSHDIQDLRELWKGKAHRRRDLTTESFKFFPAAVDLFAANWVDYIAAQMDRHEGNMYFDFCFHPHKYRGLKLIDSDQSFGTVTDPETLRRIRGSQNCGIPDWIPAGLGQRIRSIVQAIPSPGTFYNLCQEGASQIAQLPSQQVNALASQPQAPRSGNSLLQQGSVSNANHGNALQQAPQQAEPMNVQEAEFQLVQGSRDSDILTNMAEIARLLSPVEFVGLMQRMSIAAQRAPAARELNQGTLGTLIQEYSTLVDRARSNNAEDVTRLNLMTNRSYWHRLMSSYHPNNRSCAPLAQDNPPESPERWIHSLQGRATR